MTDRETYTDDAVRESPTLGVPHASAPSVERCQLIWDQILARAWIVEMSIGDCYSSYARATDGAGNFDDMLRVPKQWHRKPVRAIFADTWPKLSAWLWKIPRKTLLTDEFEARLVRLLQERNTAKDGFGKSYAAGSSAEYQRAHRSIQRACAELTRRRATRDISNRWNAWGTTKAVRSK